MPPNAPAHLGFERVQAKLRSVPMIAHFLGYSQDGSADNPLGMSVIASFQ